MSSKKQRIRVVRLDGKAIHLVTKRAHLMVCAKGCCCGRTDRGFPAVPVDFYKSEYKRRKLRNRMQLSMSGCLGPCPMLNVALLFFDGRPVWFQSINQEGPIAALYDYIEHMLATDGYLPPPPELEEYVFNYYSWANAFEARPRTIPLEMGESSRGARTHSTQAAAGGILFLTHADTDLLCLQHARPRLPEGFPAITALGLSKVTSAEHMNQVLAEHGPQARVVVVRLLGSLQSVPGGKALVAYARAHGQHLILSSGTGNPDPELTASSTVSPAVVHEVTAYLQAGGVVNFAPLLCFLADHFLMTGFGFDAPQPLPQHGIYHPDLGGSTTLAEWRSRHDPTRPTVGIVFYRSHWMSGNLAFIDALVRAIEARGAQALPVFTSSLKDCGDPSLDSSFCANPPTTHPDGRGRGQFGRNDNSRQSARWPAAFDFLLAGDRVVPDVLIATLSFAMGDVNPDGPTPGGWSVQALEALGVPVLQAICAGTARWQWEASPRGLNPLDTAMNIALPEFDGRIIGVPVSFKESADRASDAAVAYVPVSDRVERVAGMALRWAALRRKPNAEKRIAFVLTNSPGKAARIGNAVGLDAPASLIRILEAMREAGYAISPLPHGESDANAGDALIHALIDRCSYDETMLTTAQLAQAAGRVSSSLYATWFAELSETQRQKITAQWGPPPGAAFVHDNHLCLAGLDLGNAFLALQPPRGFGMDPNAIYHRPDLPPTHHYYALYRWLRDVWQADAIVHVGKHGTLEWLPGKGVGLSADCFPDCFLADLPLIYPFILNDPGEGAQAKRRAHAVVVDHLTPPLTTADAYGEIAQLMQLVDEYYQVELLDPSKTPLLQQQIWDLIKQAHLEDDLKLMMKRGQGDHTHEWDEGLTDDGTPISIAQMQGRDVAHLVQELDGYLCELAGAQIRDGLHVLGKVPEGETLVDLLVALTRLPNLEVPSLRTSLARCFALDLDILLRQRGGRIDAPETLARLEDRPLATNADALETIDDLGKHLLLLLQECGFDSTRVDEVLASFTPVAHAPGSPGSTNDTSSRADLRTVLAFVCDRLVPTLQQTTDEITNLLAALEGRYVPAGPSGAPTRGMAHVLPTGRNFYAVDPRALPSAAAWRVGQQLACEVLDRFRRETSAYPESVGISIWGTSAMRTHGDDVAQVLALLGVRPLWQKENRRLIGVEVIPLEELGRPRVDVTVRISGFFRDAFPHLIRLLDEAVRTVATRDEPVEQNFVRKHYLADLAANLAAALPPAEAERCATYRLFGAKPGSYGAGLLPLIDERNWRDDADFAEAYVNWGGYAYSAEEQGTDARDVFRHRLAGVQLALHNQDNREHDILDSDDYFQFHGGMIATIRALTGQKPRHYFGDSHDPDRPAVRDLQEEVLRVFRTRVVNPKWLDSITRHGYKGGLELAATVDYLFGFSATASVVEDWMYEQVAQAYALDPALRDFFTRSNPWALHGIAERLLEAASRGLWAKPNAETEAALRGVLLDSETMLEMRSEQPPGSSLRAN